MSIQDQLEREIEFIEQDCAEGLITNAEAQRQIRELIRDYQGAAHEAAREAYEGELERW